MYLSNVERSVTPLHCPKKQVRFNSSNMSSPSDTQTPRPLSEIQNIKRDNFITKIPKFNEIKEKVAEIPLSKPSSKIPYLPPNILDSKTTCYNSKDLSVPKPCSDLELSVFESSSIVDCGPRRPKNIADMSLDKKLLENDLPYQFSPLQMPLSNCMETVKASSRTSSDFFTSPKETSNRENICYDDATLNFFTRPITASGINKPAVKKISENVQRISSNSERNEQVCEPPTRKVLDSRCIISNNTCNFEISGRTTKCNSNHLQEKPTPICNCMECNKNICVDYCCTPKPLQCQHSCCSRSMKAVCQCTSCNDILTSCTKTKEKSIIDDVGKKQKLIEKRCGQQNVKKVVSEETKTLGPTVADLYKVIQSQSQQLQMLQERFDKLLSTKESAQLMDFNTSNKLLTSNAANYNDSADSDNINVNCVEHISIGVMTSFEMIMSSNSGGEHMNRNTGFNDKIAQKRNDEIKLNSPQTQNQIIPTCTQSPIDSNKNFLDGIDRVNNMPSNQAYGDKVLHIIEEENCGNMIQNDPIGKEVHPQVKTVPNQQKDTASAENNRGEGWTFYNNVVNRVNDLLNSPPNAVGQSKTKDVSPILATEAIQTNTEVRSSSKNRAFMETPKRDTVRASPQRVTDTFDKPLTDLSLHMKQLASKYNITPNAGNVYLHPAVYGESARPIQNVAATNYIEYRNLDYVDTNNRLRNNYVIDGRNDLEARGFYQTNNLPQYNIPDPYQQVDNIRQVQQCVVGKIENNNMFRGVATDVSFATLQYMQRYQLLTVSNEHQSPMKVKTTPNRPLPPAYKNPSRILDITTLKQQPKLI